MIFRGREKGGEGGEGGVGKSLMNMHPIIMPPLWMTNELMAGCAITAQHTPTVMANWQHKIE